MKRSFAGFLVLSLVAFTGCNTKSSPGGPGATNPSGKGPLYGQAEDTFTLSMPGSTTIKQGDTKEVVIGIKRGKNFQEEVTLKFAELPKGVALHHASSVIKHGDTEAKLTLTAAEDAALGDFTVKVIGHPTKGPDSPAEIKITVDKK